MHYSQKRARGFTLIELLIVIVIIGLLTGLATTSYINAQKNARDNTRKSGVASISTAVEAFYQTKRRFPGLMGNEGGTVISDLTNNASLWAGCLAIDTTNASILYYSYPTLPVTNGGVGNTVACGDRTSSIPNSFNPNHFKPYPSWIPELGEYLNPAPLESRYQNATGALQPLGNSGIINSQNDDVLGSGVAQSYVYRHLDGGYMVYTRLETNTTDTPTGAPMTDRPKYPNGNNVQVWNNATFMIRK